MTKAKIEAQNPLILRCLRLTEAFAKSDDERDFYLDRMEGFIIYADLDKPQNDLEALEKELKTDGERYCLLPKLTFYETKKIMEGFVNEKVYDIDTKEKLLDIIQSKEARENFLEFIYDHHSELEKWQQYYQERSRIRIIEWLRQNHFHFVFEEDLDLPKSVIEKLKRHLFDTKAGKDIVAARKTLVTKAKTYYSNEALNPRPKRGRPPKQTAKLEIEPQISTDIYTAISAEMRPFLFTPDHAVSSLATFSSKFETEEELLAHRRSHQLVATPDTGLESLNLKLASLRSLSSKWLESEAKKSAPAPVSAVFEEEEWEEEPFADEEELEIDGEVQALTPPPAPKKAATPTKIKEAPPSKKSLQKAPPEPKKPLPPKKQPKTVMPKPSTTKKPPQKIAPKKAPPKKPLAKPAPKKAPPKAKPPTKAKPPSKPTAKPVAKPLAKKPVVSKKAPPPKAKGTSAPQKKKSAPPPKKKK